MMRQSSLWIVAAVTLVAGAWGMTDEWKSGVDWTEPRLVDTSTPVPSDAKVLFGGDNMDAWNGVQDWVIENGYAQIGSSVSSQDKFGDCQLHIEWSAPTPAVGSGQGRGNSGVFMMGKYELQVLDSFDNATYFDGQAGAIYKQTPPMANAMRKPGEWNAYDIFWTCPKFKDDGSLESPAYITAVHNGVLILNHFALLGDTPFNRPPEYKAHPAKGPISLQDHGNPVRFRNIWLRELKPVRGVPEREPFLRKGDKEVNIAKPIE